MKSVHTFLIFIFLLSAAPRQGWSQPVPAEAFENVTIHLADGEVINNGSIVWREGIIQAVGREVAIPFDAYVRDGGDSLHVYPGFIDGMALWGSPDDSGSAGSPAEPGNPGYERAGIQPHRHPSNHLRPNDNALEMAPEAGFTTAVLGLEGQMLPGQADLFFIDGKQTPDKLLERGVGVLAQFKKAKGSAYPSTTMALMARFRQLFYDAEAQMEQQEYYASVASDYPAPKNEKVLEALYPVMKQEKPFFFVADTKEDIERLFELQDQLGFEVILVSGREAHKKASELQERDIPVLASIDLPEKPDWMLTEEEKEQKEKEAEEQEREEKNKKEKPEEVTEEMKRFRKRQQNAYNEHIANIKTLIEAGVRVGYASNGLKISDIGKNVKTLEEEAGMSEMQILAMFSQSTADILGYGSRMGDLKKGRLANFTAFDRPFTDDKAKGLFSVSNGDLTELESE